MKSFIKFIQSICRRSAVHREQPQLGAECKMQITFCWKTMHNLNGELCAPFSPHPSSDVLMSFNKFIEIEDYLRAICINLKSSFKWSHLIESHPYAKLHSVNSHKYRISRARRWAIWLGLRRLFFSHDWGKKKKKKEALKFLRCFQIARSIHRLLNNYLNLNKIIKIFSRICMNLIYQKKNPTKSEDMAKDAREIIEITPKTCFDYREARRERKWTSRWISGELTRNFDFWRNFH